MNVVCTQCSTKYAISDDRVLGRKVRIKCKRCGSPIVVDGTAPKAQASGAATGGSSSASPAHTSSGATGRTPQKTIMGYAAPNLSAGDLSAGNLSADLGVPTAVSPPHAANNQDPEQADLWAVAVTDDDTREMTSAEVVDAYAARTIDQFTYVWREGMGDWQTVFDIPDLARALEARGLHPSNGGSQASSSADTVEWREPAKPSAPENPLPTLEASSDDVTRTMTREELEAAQSAEHSHEASFFTPKGQAGRAKVSDRPSGVDLFGGARPPHHGEFAERDAPTAPADDGAFTGARNESSVLFSLNALVGGAVLAPKPARPNNDRVDEESVLGSSSIAFSDPIAQLGVGVDPMLAAEMPSIPPPVSPVAPVDAQSLAAPPPRGRAAGGAGLWLALGGVVIAAGGIFVMIATGVLSVGAAPPPATPAQPQVPSQATQIATPAPAPVPTPASTAALAPQETATPQPSANPAAAAGAPSSPSPAPMETSAPQLSAAGTAPTVPTTPAAAVPAQPVPTAARPQARASAAPQPAAPQPAAPAAPAPSPAPPAEASPAAASGFSTDAARATLASAAANATTNCKLPGTPAGTGKVTITFVPSGRATQTLVAGDFAGTPAGSCIARVFRGAQVPPFSGASVTVTKSVTLH